MRAVTIDTNNKVTGVYENDTIDAIQAYLDIINDNSKLIAAPNGVLVGYTYNPDTKTFTGVVVDAPNKLLSIEEVAEQLDECRTKVVTTYIARWGNASHDILWPLLSKELDVIKLLAVEDIVPGNFNSLVAFAEESGVQPEAATLKALSEELLSHKRAHVRLLRKTELLYMTLVNKYKVAYTANDRTILDTWDSESQWEALYTP